MLFSISCIVLCLMFASGCRKPKLDGLVPVKGTVVFQGQGLEGAIITFSPKTYKQGNRAAVAATDKNGRFELTTLGEKGAQPNEYRVSIVKNLAENVEKPAPGKPPRRPKAVSMIPQRYNDEKKSGIELVIGEKGSLDLVIELQGEAS